MRDKKSLFRFKKNKNCGKFITRSVIIVSCIMLIGTERNATIKKYFWNLLSDEFVRSELRRNRLFKGMWQIITKYFSITDKSIVRLLKVLKISSF